MVAAANHEAPAFLGWEPVLLQDACPAQIAGELSRRCVRARDMALAQERAASASLTLGALSEDVRAVDSLRALVARWSRAVSALLNDDMSSPELHAARLAEVETSGVAMRLGARRDRMVGVVR